MDKIKAREITDALSGVCENVLYRFRHLGKPYRRGGYVYATDGKVAFRYKIDEADAGLFEEDAEAPNAEHVFDRPGEGESFGKTDIEYFVDAVEKCHRSAKELTGRQNPRGLPEYSCPCCSRRVYKVDERLVDADEYDEKARDWVCVVVRHGDAASVFPHDRIKAFADCGRKLHGFKSMRISGHLIMAEGDGFQACVMGLGSLRDWRGTISETVMVTVTGK